MNIIDFEDLIELHMSFRDLYRIRLDFRFDECVCTRLLIVNSDSSLDDLHTIIQACGNWPNCHFYDFKFVRDEKLVQAVPSWQIDEYGGPGDTLPVLDSGRISIKEALLDFPTVIYSYDYGDGWEILITFLGIVSPSDKSVPYCEGGKGDWPPDDIGGESGFNNLIETLKDSSNEDYEEMLNWATEQGYEKYQLVKCNQRLSHWQLYERDIFE